jgi:predicted nuclease of predicted toxin-antitoxin system
MCFFLDEDLSDDVAVIARNMGLDVCSVHEVERRGLDDSEQFEYAIEHGRIMVTRNRDDYLVLNREFFAAQKPTCGLLVVPYSLPNDRPDRIAHALRRWAELWEAVPEGFSSYAVGFLSISRQDQ